MLLPTFLIFMVTIPPPSYGNRGESHCELPSSWTGRWFESGEREAVTVQSKNITHKGECIFQKGDKYIFKDEKHHCFRCAVMHQKHENVLQYKESFCEPNIGRRHLDLCYGITADSALKSMFRLDIQQFEDCPIEGAYSFTYSRGHGLCEYPKSSLSQCSDKSKLVFRYQACADIKGSESNVEEVQCVAQWKEGSTFFFLGLLNHSHVLASDYEGRFRCFAYQNIYEGFLVSQSGEAVCSLYTAKEGDRTMTLKRVQNYEETCELPSWLIDPKHPTGIFYENLNATKKFHLKPNSLVVTTKHASQEAGAGGHQKTKMSLNCNSIEQNSEIKKFARLVMQVNFDCESGFVCLEIERKSENILSLRMGRLSRNQDEACNTQLFFDANIPTSTIINSNHASQRCPLVGKYTLRRTNSDTPPIPETRFSTPEPCNKIGMSERENLMFGCSGESEFNLVTRCRQEMDEPEVPNSHFVEEFVSEEVYTCLGGWKEPSDPQDDVIVTTGIEPSGTLIDPKALRFSPTTQYMIVSGPHRKKKLCLKLTSTKDNERTELLASPSECPSGLEIVENPRSSKTEKFSGAFVLTRQSECAQALATANSAISANPLPNLGLSTLILPSAIILLLRIQNILFLSNPDHHWISSPSLSSNLPTL